MSQEFQDNVTQMLCPDSPTGRVPEEKFRDILFSVATTSLPKEEVELIFPVLSKEGGSRKGSKHSTDGPRKKGSKQRHASKEPKEKAAEG